MRGDTNENDYEIMRTLLSSLSSSDQRGAEGLEEGGEVENEGDRLDINLCTTATTTAAATAAAAATVTADHHHQVAMRAMMSPSTLSCQLLVGMATEEARR